MRKYSVAAPFALLLFAGLHFQAAAQTTPTTGTSTTGAPTTSPPMTGTQTTGSQQTNKDLAASAAISDNYSTLNKALSAAGLADRAKARGPYTVFAPTNAAFDKLPAGTLDNLLLPANKKKLTGLLTYHVVSGSYKAADLRDGQKLKTIQGESLTVSKQGDTVTIKDAKGGSATVDKADIQATNGVVHSIDSVLMPSK